MKSDHSSDKEEESPQKIDIELINKLKSKLEEYRNVIRYFNTIESPLIEDVYTKAKKINASIKTAEKGETVDISTLPLDAITSEYICGCSQIERELKYTTLIASLITQLKDEKELLSNYLNKVQLMPKKDYKKHEALIKKEISIKKEKISQSEKMLKEIEEEKKNNWIPPPIYMTIVDNREIEKINTTIEENKMRITFGKYSFKENISYLYIVLNYGDNKSLFEYIYPESDSDFNKTIEWSFNKNEFNNLYSETLEISYYINWNYWIPFMKYKSASGELCLSSLYSKGTITTVFELEPYAQKRNFTPKVEIKIEVRTPCVELEYTTIAKDEIIIAKRFPAYNESNNNMHIGGKENKNKNEEMSNKNNNIDVIDESKCDNKDKINKSIFKESELNEPDSVVNMISLYALENKEKEFYNLMRNTKGKVPKSIREDILKIRTRKKFIEDKIKNKEMTKEKYKTILQNQLEHLELLKQYFIQENEKDKAEKVYNHIMLITNEISIKFK